MYRIGDKVIYGIHGVCVITEMENRTAGGKQATYLVLEPPGQTGSRFMIPTQNAAAMSKIRPMLSSGEMETLLSSAQILSDGWISDEGKRKQRYRELITGSDRGQLICMVSSLYRHQSEQTALGKRLHMCDENFLRDAEKILSGEIAAAMDLTYTEAVSYLRKKLNEDA